MSTATLNTCGCSEGVTAPTPATLDNPPGLSALAYRIGTHGQFKSAMLAELSKKRALDGLPTRADDDPAIALLDGWAGVLDVLSFYQERIANEGYLRTATERRSILELARSIGYELRPGVAATAYFALTLDDAPQAPREATIPVGAKVQSVPGQDEKPQLFETVEDLQARAEWNAIRARLRELKLPGFGATQVTLKGTATNLKPGDAILFVGEERTNNPGAENWDFRRVTKVEPVFTDDAKNDYTVVSWDRPLGQLRPYGPVAAKPRVFALRQRASLFGHNAPDWRALHPVTQSHFTGGDRKDWPQFNVFALGKPEREGLLGEYFANADLTGAKELRLDATVNIDEAATAASERLVPGKLSARWSGLVTVGEADWWTFSVETDGAVRLWVDSQLLFQAWTAKTAGVHSDKIYLTNDTPHDLRLEYSRRGTTPKVRLSWSQDGGSARIMPQSSLRPPEVHLDAAYPKVQAGSWLAISQPSYQELYRVEDTVEDSQTNFMLTSQTARVTLSGENLRLFNDQLRSAAVFAESEELFIAEQPRTDTISDQEIELESAVMEFARGRKLIVSGQRVYAKVLQTVTHQIARTKSVRKSSVNLRTAQGASSVSLRTGQIMRVASRPVVSSQAELEWHLIEEAGFVVSLHAPAGSLEFVKEGATTYELVEVDSVRRESDGRLTILLTSPLQHSYDRDTVRVSANIACATQGESKVEVLGSGNASRSFQKFTLKQTPLTFVSASRASGTESTLEVRVNDVLWTEAPSFFGLDPDDRCYVTRQADDGKTTVMFGDGVTGARPPTGVENIRANYRVGLGLAANLKADQLNLLLTRPLGVKAVTNPKPSTNGDDAEPRDAARQNAPLTVLTLDRVVSLQDFEDFARAFAGLGKAQATWVWSGTQRLVFLTVAGADGGTLIETQPPLSNLLPALDAAREPMQPVQVGVFAPLQFKLQAKVLLQAGYLAEKVYASITSALLDNFSFARRSFGQAVTASEVLAVMQGIEGVAAVDLDALHLDGKAANLSARLPANIARWDETERRILPAELLTLGAAGIELREMKP